MLLGAVNSTEKSPVAVSSSPSPIGTWKVPWPLPSGMERVSDTVVLFPVTGVASPMSMRDPLAKPVEFLWNQSRSSDQAT